MQWRFFLACFLQLTSFNLTNTRFQYSLTLILRNKCRLFISDSQISDCLSATTPTFRFSQIRLRGGYVQDENVLEDPFAPHELNELHYNIGKDPAAMASRYIRHKRNNHVCDIVKLE